MVQAGIPYYGVRPSYVVDGKRVRFVGDKMFVRPAVQTFHEFVLSYLRIIFGKPWFDSQKAFPPERQHQAFRWFEAARQFMEPLRSKAIADGQDHFSADAPGDLADLQHLAHDVFHLANAGIFDTKLRRRLLDKKAFQGACYEVAVAALLTRAGLQVEFVYDRVKKHHDLQAVDLKTDTTLAIEVKSRHRAGAVHEPGPVDPDRIQRGDIASLIDQALEQNPGGRPFVIFVDLNVPRESGVPVEKRPWFQDVWTDMQSLGNPTPEKPDDFSAIFITNFSHHWAGPAISAGVEYLHIVSHRARYPLPDDLVGRLMAAVQNYSFVPRQF